MTTVSVVLFLFLISGIGCAWFAAARHRNQAGWFLLGCLTGPLGLFVLLLLPGLSDSQRRVKMKKSILGLVAAFAFAVIVTLGLAEFFERYEEGERYVELDNWASYGDALIRFTKSTEHPSDAIVVKAAYKQIGDYELQLQDGMSRIETDILLAMQGVRNSTGARAILENGLRILTFRAPQWPVPIALSAREQSVAVTELRDRLVQYDESLKAIQAANIPSPHEVAADE